jgi:hypothetical protein
MPMIFRNPSGAPELACDACGCRWFDRMTGACYECGTPVPPRAQAEFSAELEAFAAQRERAKEQLTSALEFLEGGDWRSAHRIVQRDEDDALACWAHEIVYLMEGDASNARYWYRRAGRELPAPVRIDAELEAQRAALDG